jgi:hypothetical protein
VLGIPRIITGLKAGFASEGVARGSIKAAVPSRHMPTRVKTFLVTCIVLFDMAVSFQQLGDLSKITFAGPAQDLSQGYLS